ncbi:MAG: glutamate-5-semialdehyde dehydrogenase, partial [Candidatus Omnitrophica bacterium]|nr:glutamate-5-semialdehyde dehydrogenase [Candidatus Omnitrophota bacterium]
MKKALYAMAQKAKEARADMASLSSDVKNNILLAMADGLDKNKREILRANLGDVKDAAQKRVPPALKDRLTLTDARVRGMVETLREVALLPDPVGAIEHAVKRPNGLLIGRMRVPIGVIGIIYEARPNVTADCIGLSLKSGNALILRGGSEAMRSNTTIVRVLKDAGVKAGLPASAVNFIDTTDRKAVDIMLGMSGIIDLVIPRGGESLIREVVEKAKVPVIKHAKGVCHVYVDEEADLNMAEEIVYNAKVQRPGVCNAMETLLVHKDIAARFLPHMAKRLKSASVELRGCAVTRSIVKGMKAATEADWYEEYLALILSVRVVDSLDQAIMHIGTYGSMHSDAIVTANYAHAMRFMREVDSACVY